MELIIGGAYQGKLAYAKETFSLAQEDIFVCSETCTRIDFTKKAVYGIELFTLACVRAGVSPRAYFEAHRGKWARSVLICTDISCGVVPVDAQLRAWREETGRLLNDLSAGAGRVTRLFCGIAQVIK